jgi:hypothetical protein
MKVSGDHHRIKARGSWGGATQDDQTILTEDEQAGTRNEGMCANDSGNQRRLPRSIHGRRSTHRTLSLSFFLFCPSVANPVVTTRGGIANRTETVAACYPRSYPRARVGFSSTPDEPATLDDRLHHIVLKEIGHTGLADN